MTPLALKDTSSSQHAHKNSCTSLQGLSCLKYTLALLVVGLLLGPAAAHWLASAVQHNSAGSRYTSCVW